MQQSEGVISHSRSNVVVDFFNRRAEDYDREYNYKTPGGYALRVRRQKVVELLDQPLANVLDVGCGPGAMVEEMLKRGCEFWGVDPSQKMLDICRGRFAQQDRAHFLCADAMGLPLADESFDAVLCMGVIDGLRNRRQAIREMLRVLRPGGTLIVTFTNWHSPYAWWKNYVFYPAISVWHALRERYGGDKPRHARRSGGIRALYSKRAACDLLRSEGAEIVKTLGYHYNIFISPLDEVMPSLALRVNEKLEWQTRPSLNWIAAGLILKARKL